MTVSGDALDLNSMTSLGSNRTGSLVERGLAGEMKAPEIQTLTIARQELEESWRLKLQEAQNRYQVATREYRNVLQEQPEWLTPSADGPVVQTRQAESQALAEYTRVLRVFTDLTVHGKMPDEQGATGSDLP